MSSTTRRDFIRGVGLSAAAPAIRASQGSPNERINVAVVGFHGRGRSHYREFARLPNVRVAVLCDVDERLFPEAVGEVEKLAGYRPATEVDFRKLLDNKDIHAVSIATPDYWHALQTIWACQAGKDVYVEKPVSFTVVEGRRMVEAARKYRRIVQAGLNRRSSAATRAAMRLLHDGKLGPVYRSKVGIVKPRGSIGTVQESSIPPGVHWDLYLGPTPYRAFTPNHFHYGWHFFWDTSTTDVGNTGVHSLDVLRWGMNKRSHPVKVHSTGGFYAWEAEQQVPNYQTASFEYADGSLMEIQISNLFGPPSEDNGEVFFTTKGFMTSEGGWKTSVGTLTPRSRIDPAGIDERATNASFPRVTYAPGPALDEYKQQTVSHFQNFIDCVRSRKVEDLYCEILEGHMSTALCHIANLSFRTGRKLVFDPDKERFVGDEEANKYLTRTYRAPYVLPDKV